MTRLFCGPLVGHVLVKEDLDDVFVWPCTGQRLIGRRGGVFMFVQRSLSSREGGAVLCVCQAVRSHGVVRQNCTHLFIFVPWLGIHYL